MAEITKISEYFAELQAKTIRYTAKVSDDIQKIISQLDSGSLRVCAKFGDEFVINQDVKKAKPAPDIYLKAAELLNLRPDECLVVEDNQHGIAAATAAGTHVLVVNSVSDVNYHNITERIAQIEGAK